MQVIENPHAKLFADAFNQGLSQAMQMQMQQRQFKQQQEVAQQKSFMEQAQQATPDQLNMMDPKIAAKSFGSKENWEAFKHAHTTAYQTTLLAHTLISHLSQQGINLMDPNATTRALAPQAGTPLGEAAQQEVSQMQQAKYPMAEAKMKAATATEATQAKTQIEGSKEVAAQKRQEMADKTKEAIAADRDATLRTIAGGKQKDIEKNFGKNLEKYTNMYPKNWSSMYKDYAKQKPGDAKNQLGAEMQSQAWQNVSHVLAFVRNTDDKRAMLQQFNVLARTMPFMGYDGKMVLGYDKARATYTDPKARDEFDRMVKQNFLDSVGKAQDDRQGMESYYGAGVASGVGMGAAAMGTSEGGSDVVEQTPDSPDGGVGAGLMSGSDEAQ